jgi:hypothetical protein
MMRKANSAVDASMCCLTLSMKLMRQLELGTVLPPISGASGQVVYDVELNAIYDEKKRRWQN